MEELNAMNYHLSFETSCHDIYNPIFSEDDEYGDPNEFSKNKKDPNSKKVAHPRRNNYGNIY